MKTNIVSKHGTPQLLQEQMAAKFMQLRDVVLVLVDPFERVHTILNEPRTHENVRDEKNFVRLVVWRSN